MSEYEPQTNNPVSWFYSATRPKADVRQIQYDAADNLAQQSYQLKPSGCQTPSATGNFASQFVTMNWTGNFGNTPAGGCDVDLYSRILLGDPNTQREKGHQQTFARPWASTPFMNGVSPADRDTETKLIQSQPVRQRKECSTVTDKFFSNQFDPLLPSVKREIANPDNWIMQGARGGAPTRILHQNVN